MKYKILIIIGVLIHILIFTQSLLPGSVSSNQSGFIVDTLYPLVSSVGINISVNTFSFIIRKAAHFTEFFLLGLVWYMIYSKYFNKIKLVVIVLTHGILTAILDESIQLFVSGRSGEIRDVLIDFSGVLSGVLMIHINNLILKKRINNFN